MYKPTFSVTALGLALLALCVSASAKPPTCAQPVGKWRNERGSVLDIRSYDASTGAIAGQYTSNSGTLDTRPTVGWVNDAPAENRDPKGNYAKVITFLVHWGPNSSVSAWNGTCAVNSHSGREQILALWNPARPNAETAWNHVLIGEDRLDPIE